MMRWRVVVRSWSTLGLLAMLVVGCAQGSGGDETSTGLGDGDGDGMEMVTATERAKATATAGNRAPMMFGTHTDDYSSKYEAAPNSTPEERREAIEEFLDCALAKVDVRVVSNAQILDWVREPSPL